MGKYVFCETTGREDRFSHYEDTCLIFHLQPALPPPNSYFSVGLHIYLFGPKLCQYHLYSSMNFPGLL